MVKQWLVCVFCFLFILYYKVNVSGSTILPKNDTTLGAVLLIEIIILFIILSCCYCGEFNLHFIACYCCGCHCVRVGCGACCKKENVPSSVIRNI